MFFMIFYVFVIQQKPFGKIMLEYAYDGPMKYYCIEYYASGLT